MNRIMRTHTLTQPPRHWAIHSDDNARLLGHAQVSTDHGETWTPRTYIPPSVIPVGGKRDPVVLIRDPNTDRIVLFMNCIDANVGGGIEPPAALKNYYVRYRVSTDGGATWGPDEQIICEGQTPQQSIAGVTLGKNCVYLGDIGCRPIIDSGVFILPVQTTVLATDGNTLYSPAGTGWYFFDTIILRGTWGADGKLSWTSSRIPGVLSKSVRGYFEPTIVRLSDGRILCVMRGSNGGATDPQYQLPSRRWASWSSDGGVTWTPPVSWSCGNGEPIISPSSMSSLFALSNGTLLWCGNRLKSGNAVDNGPRFPLVIMEVDPLSGLPHDETQITIDTQSDADTTQGRCDIIHVWLCEDRRDGSVWLTYPRNHHSYQDKTWVTVRIEL